jgi:hypothetical protein
MKSQKVFWTTISFLAILTLGGCLHLATQQRGPVPASQQQQDSPVRESME